MRQDNVVRSHGHLAVLQLSPTVYALAERDPATDRWIALGGTETNRADALYQLDYFTDREDF